MWTKHGQIIDEKMIGGFSVSHAAIPYAHCTAEGKYQLFFASRDTQSRSHIYRADIQVSAKKVRVDEQSIVHVFAPGKRGAFDDSGVMPGWIVKHENHLRLYYSGWSLGKTVPFYFYIGLAISTDCGRSFERVSEAPVLGRNKFDPYLTGSPCVLKEEGRWRMWYVSGRNWEEKDSGELKHYYFLRGAESENGIDWHSYSTPCIDFSQESEYAMARPCVVPVKDGYLMWYAFRGSTYRMGLAVSKDGISWTRMDAQAGIKVSSTGWDSEMIEYAHIFSDSTDTWMLYNGNGYGKTGIGLAHTSKLPSVSELLAR